MGFFLWLSDLHLDPFYGTANAMIHDYPNGVDCSRNDTILRYPYGRVGCDVPLSLIESSLRNVKNNLSSNNNSASNSDSNSNSNSNATKITASNIDFILVTGDFVRHMNDEVDGDPIAFTESVLSTCIQSIQSVFPNVPIIPVLGNNDITPDYYLDVHEGDDEDNKDKDKDNNTGENITNSSSSSSNSSSNMTNHQNKTNTLLVMARDGLSEAFLSEEEARTFAHGGYYSRIVETTASSSSILVLSLNTVIYSVRHQPAYFDADTEEGGGDDDDPLGQFAWIESQLRTAAAAAAAAASNSTKNNNIDNITAIYVVGHIPPTIGSYRHSQLWQERYVDRYTSILKKYYYNHAAADTSTVPPPPIRGNLFGHVHTEEFRLLTYSNGNDDESEDEDDKHKENNNAPPALVVPLLLTSSLTPIFGSNPSYRIVEYDDDSGALLDYITYYLDLSRWPSLTTQNENENENTVPAAAAAAAAVETSPPVWIQLPGFAETYGVSDLSSDSFETILARLEEEMEMEHQEGTTTTTTMTSLWETFLKRQHVYSSSEDDGDDNDNNGLSNSDIMTDWICTLRATSKDDYTTCLEVRSSAMTMTIAKTPPPSGGIILFLIASTTISVVGVLIAVVLMGRRRAVTRRHYSRPSLELDGVVIDIDTNTDERRSSSSSSSPKGIDIELT